MLNDLVNTGVIPSGITLPLSGTEGALFFLLEGNVGLYMWHLTTWELLFLDDNINLLRDSIILGAIPGWNMTTHGANIAQPDQVKWTNGNEMITGTLTWGANHNVSTATYQHTSDGSGWTDLGTVTYAYSDNNILSATWS